MSDNNLTVSIAGNVELNLNIQQQVALKYVFNNKLCDAVTKISDIKKGNGLTYLIIDYPKELFYS